MSTTSKSGLFGIIFAVLAWVGLLPALAAPPGIPVALSYTVHETESGLAVFDLKARNIGIETTYQVLVAEANGAYPTIYFGDLAPGQSAAEPVRLTYQGEPPRLEWVVTYSDAAGRQVTSSYPQ